MARQLTELAVVLRPLGEIGEALQHAVGGAAKAGALEAAAKDLGADRRFSGIPSRAAALNAGYDTVSDGVVLHLRPEGLWKLADQGRRRSGDIRPKRSRRGGNRKPRGRAAVGSGSRFVAVGRYRPSRGLGTIDDALELIDRDVERAAGDVVEQTLRSL